ncbi:XRE family transcriptional regulator [bacterium]|jgi:transcriptional regulator with XRE-family HTH domain|nr:XRE family transcriptional regulator [bacterium]
MTTFKRNFKFEENIMVRVSKNIRKYRKIANITQEQLAVDVEKSYDFIRRLEYKNGKIGCSVDTLYRISVVLGITMDKLFE